MALVIISWKSVEIHVFSISLTEFAVHQKVAIIYINLRIYDGFLDDIDNDNLIFLDFLDQLCASWTLVFKQKVEPKNTLYKLNALSYSTNISNASDIKM